MHKETCQKVNGTVLFLSLQVQRNRVCADLLTIRKNSRFCKKVSSNINLGMKIVAEGIETEEEYQLIKEYGADEGQGVYFSTPIPEADFARLLRRKGGL